MTKPLYAPVEEARKAAIEVLLHNMHGPYRGLPRTAGWGYPEPYTRDLMIAGLGALASGNELLINSLQRVLRTLADNQTARGHIPSLVHDPEDRGASDTTPLFLMTLGLFRRVTGDQSFLDEAAERALTWMAYQSPSDRVMVAQLPTSDWRDEQWVLGFGLFVNAVLYAALRLFKRNAEAKMLRDLMVRLVVTGDAQHRHVHEGLRLPHKPYYGLWSYKIYSSERFDLLGNSIALLAGIPAPHRAKSLVHWIEHECQALQEADLLAVDLPPCLFPYIRPGDRDWRDRYVHYNQPGEYHNGGIWPYVCGFYVAGVLATGSQRLATQKIEALTHLVRPAREQPVSFGFNEWFRAQDGTPQGQDWQTWSAAMYLYAMRCVEEGHTLFFDEVRSENDSEH